jgi:hypothetical protein
MNVPAELLNEGVCNRLTHNELPHLKVANHSQEEVNPISNLTKYKITPATQ